MDSPALDAAYVGGNMSNSSIACALYQQWLHFSLFGVLCLPEDLEVIPLGEEKSRLPHVVDKQLPSK